MTIIRDIKGRPYAVLETGIITTLLECLNSGSRVRIPSHDWEAIGFIRP